MSRVPPQAYLLRLWRDHAGAPLRATLIAVAQPNAPQHFASLDALFAFLRAQTDPGALSAEGQARQAPELDHPHCTPDRPAWEERLD
jgi:hypothetical protein